MAFQVMTLTFIGSIILGLPFEQHGTAQIARGVRSTGESEFFQVFRTSIVDMCYEVDVSVLYFLIYRKQARACASISWREAIHILHIRVLR